MIALNNPMNIRISAVAWRNKDAPSRNAQFETFPTPEDGLHAGMENTLNCQLIHACYSISSIISRLSPPTENDTPGYIQMVCDLCGAQEDEDYDLTIAENLIDLSKAIILRENGEQPYPDALLQQIAHGLVDKTSTL